MKQLGAANGHTHVWKNIDFKEDGREVDSQHRTQQREDALQNPFFYKSGQVSSDGC